MNKIILASVMASAAFVASPSTAATVVTNCAALGIDDIVPNAEACVGYYDKNVLTTSAGSFAKQEEVSALNLLGLDGNVGTIKVLEKLDNSGDFARLLNGLTYIGVHYGNGIKAPVANSGGVTAFYRFNAGANLNAISFTNGSVSGVSLYATGAAVPEPAVWAMMLGGFGLIGAASRRRQRSSVAYA
jgi:hypothetical protein